MLKWLCELGIHQWFYWSMDYDGKAPRRVCLRCDKVESYGETP